MGSDPTWGHQVVCDSLPGMGDASPVILARCQFGDVAGHLAELASRAAMANLGSAPTAGPAACGSTDHVNCGCLLSTPTAGQPDPFHTAGAARMFAEDDRRRKRRWEKARVLLIAVVAYVAMFAAAGAPWPVAMGSGALGASGLILIDWWLARNERRYGRYGGPR